MWSSTRATSTLPVAPIVSSPRFLLRGAWCGVPSALATTEPPKVGQGSAHGSSSKDPPRVVLTQLGSSELLAAQPSPK